MTYLNSRVAATQANSRRQGVISAAKENVQGMDVQFKCPMNVFTELQGNRYAG